MKKIIKFIYYYTELNRVITISLGHSVHDSALMNSCNIITKEWK